MKSRLASSFYLYLSGTCWRNSRSTMPSRSAVTVFNGRHCRISCSFQAQGFESSSRGFRPSALNDDAFEELGPTLPEGSVKKIKLVTEKPDDFVDDDFTELGPRKSEGSAKKIKSVTKKPIKFVVDDFTELGPGKSEGSAEKKKSVTKKPISFVVDDFTELGPGKSEGSAKKKKSVTKKPISFVDDDFAELGLGISKCSDKQIKLVTEKPDPFMKSRLLRKEVPSRPLSSNQRSSVKEILATIPKPTTTSDSKLGGHENAPLTFTEDTLEISDIESPRSVSIKNITPAIGLTELVKAISVFGKVSGASFVTTSNELRCCNIEFEDAESSRKALLSGKVSVGSQVFPVDPLDAVDVVTIRIKNINEETSNYEIHSICKSVGELVGLTRTSKDCVDAVFNVQNHTIHVDIVKRLNDTTLHLNCWSAHLLTSKCTKPIVQPSDEEARYKLGLQISDRISKLKHQTDMRKVWLEDLECLNTSIVHLKAAPPTINEADSI